MTAQNSIKVALADDHILLRNALASLIDSFDDFKVICQATDGKELIEKVKSGQLPDIILMDLNMPNLGGYETAVWFKKHLPHVRILMLTMYDSELLLIRLLQVGIKGFLRKDIHPSELKLALHSVIDLGYFYSHKTSNKLANIFTTETPNNMLLEKIMLNEQEIRFLNLACTEMTYKEIALEMGLNPRAVDSLRDNLFEKLEVKSRVGLAIYSIQKGIVTL